MANSWNLGVTHGVSPDAMESSHANATLQSVGELWFNVAVELPDPAHSGVDVADADSVDSWLADLFSSATALGCRVTVQVGLEEDEGD